MVSYDAVYGKSKHRAILMRIEIKKHYEGERHEIET